MTGPSKKKIIPSSEPVWDLYGCYALDLSSEKQKILKTSSAIINIMFLRLKNHLCYHISPQRLQRGCSNGQVWVLYILSLTKALG